MKSAATNTFPYLKVAVLICIAWTLPGLVGHEPWKPDGAYTFGLVLHLFETGDWVVPTLGGEPFMEKPPVYFITAAGFMELLGDWLSPPDAARMATGFYLLIAFLAVVLSARELYGPGKGIIALLLLIGSIGGIEYLHRMITDTALFAGIALGLYGLVLQARKPLSGGLWLGTGGGLAFLAKGLLGPGILGVLVILLPAVSPNWRDRRYLQTLGLAALAILPWLLIWPIALYHKSPELFDTWFWDNNLGRFLGTSHLGPSAEAGAYLKLMFWYTLPAWPFAVWMVWRNRTGLRTNTGVVLPLSAFLTIFLALSVASDGRGLYALPLLIPVVLLASERVTALPNSFVLGWRWGGVLIMTLLALLIWLAWSALVFNWPLVVQQKIEKVQPVLAMELHWPILVLALLATSAWVWLIARAPRNGLGSLLVWSGGITLVWLLLMSLTLPAIDKVKSYQEVFGAMAQALPADAGCIASEGLGEPQRAMIHYYLGVKTRRLENGDDTSQCHWLILQTHKRTPPLLDSRSCKLFWHGARTGEQDEWYDLLHCQK